MDWLFTILTDAMSGGMILALLASFSWGVLSILLSPCHLSGIPLIIGFLSARGENKGSRGFFLSSVFAGGSLATIAVIGALTAGLGRIMGDIGAYSKYGVAIIFVLVGLYLMDLIRLPASGMALRPLQVRSAYVSAMILGLVFGIAVGPCTFAFMAPVLGVVFQISDINMTAAGGLLLSFGLGQAGVITATGGVTSRVQAYLDWTNRSNIIIWTKRVAGFLVVLGGIYTLYSS